MALGSLAIRTVAAVSSREGTFHHTTLHNYKGPFSFSTVCLKGLIDKELNDAVIRKTEKHLTQNVRLCG